MKLHAFFMWGAVLFSGCAGVDLTENKSDVCPVHKQGMQTETVPIIYGLPLSSEFEEFKAAQGSFPFGREYRLGGTESGEAKEAQVFVCSDCKEARLNWLEEKNSVKVSTMEKVPK